MNARHRLILNLPPQDEGAFLFAWEHENRLPSQSSSCKLWTFYKSLSVSGECYADPYKVP